MGCNTSKESVPQDENKENQDESVSKTEENKEVKLSDGKAEVEKNHVQETADSKPASAKTITLRSNGSATVTIPEYNQDDTKSNAVASKNETNAEDDPEEEEKAATKIQAVFRGHKTRKSMKQPTGKVEPTTPSSQEPTREELEAEFRLDDAELCHAATKIQASFRGHMTRKEQDKQGGKKEDESSTSQAQAQEEEELDIDLTDPELNKAAVKIQASFRGHMTRKDEKN